jgi:hypothetical protein
MAPPIAAPSRDGAPAQTDAGVTTRSPRRTRRAVRQDVLATLACE